MKKLLVIIFIAFLFRINVSAAEVTPEINIYTGTDKVNQDTSILKDKSYKTAVSFKEGTRVEVSTTDKSVIKSAYIIWDSPISPYTIETPSGIINAGENGFIHEFINMNSDTFTINIPAGDCRISDIRIFGEGDIPSDVQIWEKPAEKADLLVFSCHADDEVLFFGGVLATYTHTLNAKVKIVYLSQYYDGARIREHEKLDGIYHLGIRNYPVTGSFKDLYSTDLETAKTQYGLLNIESFMVENIRRFKPQIALTHDFSGEYGHGFHMLSAEALKEAIKVSNNPASFPESFNKYGGFTPLKTYIHLYKENELNLNFREVLPGTENKTAFDLSVEAYKLHLSQQWCWFFVSDDNEYSCARYGLLDSKVGLDVQKNSLFENIITYEEQKKKEEEALAILAEQKRLEEIAKEKELKEQESIKKAVEKAEKEKVKEKNNEKKSYFVFPVAIIIVILTITIFYKKRVIKKEL